MTDFHRKIPWTAFASRELTFVELLVAIAFTSAVIFPASADDAPTKPNIVVLLSDNHKYNSLEIAGDPILTTPHLDRLARDGAWMRQACVVSPVCAPSRASFLTGMYGFHTGIRTNQGPWPEFLPPTFLSAAHADDYRTAFIGKKHFFLNDEPIDGIDYWVSHAGQARYKDPTFTVDGVKSKHFGDNGDLLTDYALDFINSCQGQPFAMVVAFKEAHNPQSPPDRFMSLYQDADISLPETFHQKLSEEPEYFQVQQRFLDSGFDDSVIGARRAPPELTREESAIKKIRNYYRNISALDEYVGRIFSALEAISELDRTIIVFAGDNGCYLGDHGRFEMYTPHEESVRIPMLMRYPPEIPAGTICDARILNIDLAPTLCDLAGIEQLADIDGKSFRSVLRNGESLEWRSDVYLEWQGPQAIVPPGQVPPIKPPARRGEGRYNVAIPTWRGLRTPTHKYVVYFDGDKSQFYDLQSDPQETVNRIDDPSQREVVRALHRRLQELAEGLDDPLRHLIPDSPWTPAPSITD